MKQINIYTSFPILEIGNFFSKKAMKPLVFKRAIDNENLLPTKTGFPKHFLLKIEHELALNLKVDVFSSFLEEKDYSPIYEIAKKYQANINLIYMETNMESLYEMYTQKKGKYSYKEFCDLYSQSFNLPSKKINKLIFEQF